MGNSLFEKVGLIVSLVILLDAIIQTVTDIVLAIKKNKEEEED